MEVWKRNLIVCWFGTFITMIGLSQIAPIMPLYIKHLGISSTALVEEYSGIAFGITYIVSAIFSPIWGKAADKYGRKLMLLRASMGMAVIILFMGFAGNVYELIALRALQGVVSGYCTACTTLIATQTDKKNAGFALGTLSTAAIAGSLLGPVAGGYFEMLAGLRSAFWIISGLLLITFTATVIFVKEDFKSSDKEVSSIKEVWKELPDPHFIIILCLTTFILQLGYFSIEPVITVYIAQISKHTSHIALLAGIVFSSSGVANVLMAPRLGKLSDKIGAQKVLLFSLVFAGIIFIPQAFVRTPYELMALRFMLGLVTAGLTPSINILLKKHTPDTVIGRIMGIGMSAQYLGAFSGSIMGGQIASHFGIRSIFFTTSTLMLINALWVYKKLYKRFSDTGTEDIKVS